MDKHSTTHGELVVRDAHFAIVSASRGISFAATERVVVAIANLPRCIN